MAASATFALKAGVWFRRGRLLIVSPDSLGTACPLSGRKSTYRPVQISGTGSHQATETGNNRGRPLGSGTRPRLTGSRGDGHEQTRVSTFLASSVSSPD